MCTLPIHSTLHKFKLKCKDKSTREFSKHFPIFDNNQETFKTCQVLYVVLNKLLNIIKNSFQVTPEKCFISQI